MSDERVEAGYLDSLKLIVKILKNQGFSGISGTEPRNAPTGYGNHIKIVSLSNSVEICVKKHVKTATSPPIEHLAHDLKALDTFFASSRIRPAKYLGQVGDVLVTESVDKQEPLQAFLINHPDLISQVHSELVQIDQKMLELRDAGEIFLEPDPFVDLKSQDSTAGQQREMLWQLKRGKAFEHVFVKSFDESNDSYQLRFIDPVDDKK